MEFEGDSPARRPPAPPEPSSTQKISVTPEDVVALATVFRECADLVAMELGHAKEIIWLVRVWMDDPVSDWFEQRLKNYLADGETALLAILQDLRDQYQTATGTLISIGEQYDLTEELVAAGFVDLGTSE